MNDESPVVSGYEAKLLAGLAAVFSIFFLYDLSQDWRSGAPTLHIVFEVCVVSASVGMSVWLWFRAAHNAREQHRVLSGEISELRAERDHWRKEAGTLLQGLGAAVDQQFLRWRLTAAEAEVGLLLLKGLSNKEIATVREVSERTVREQCSAVYSKAGLSSRSQFSAFFLEDLLLPSATTPR